jgi:hypothetical protein
MPNFFFSIARLYHRPKRFVNFDAIPSRNLAAENKRPEAVRGQEKISLELSKA